MVNGSRALDTDVLEFFWSQGANQEVFYVRLSLENPSNVPNFLARAELHINYVLEDGIEATCRLPHLAGSISPAGEIRAESRDTLSLPALVGANTIIKGWLVFAQSNQRAIQIAVSSHRLVLYGSPVTCLELFRSKAVRGLTL